MSNSINPGVEPSMGPIGDPITHDVDPTLTQPVGGTAMGGAPLPGDVMPGTTRTWEYTDEVVGTLTDRDLTGYDVEATDGSIGKIDAESRDAGSASLVVDTGWWIFGKKRLIPAAAVQQINHEDQQVFVSLTKDEIKAAPDFNEIADDRGFDDEARGVHDAYYGDRWMI